MGWYNKQRMKKKRSKSTSPYLWKLMWGHIILAIIFITMVVTALYLIYKRPQNLTKKAGVFKKTYIVSSKKECQNSGVVEMHMNGKIKLPILMYHYVEDVKDLKDTKRQKMSVRPNIFDEQLNTLVADGYTTVFMKDVPDIIRGKTKICSLAVALTFDDGYQDFYANVFPILKKYKAKATIYVISNYIGKKDFLSEKEIEELIKSGLVEVGSHTLDHADLWELNDKPSIDQIKLSKQALEERFHVSVHTFAYPFGKYKPSDINIVKEASYSAAVTVADGTWHSSENMFILPRVRPEQFIGKDIGRELESYYK